MPIDRGSRLPGQPPDARAPDPDALVRRDPRRHGARGAVDSAVRRVDLVDALERTSPRRATGATSQRRRSTPLETRKVVPNECADRRLLSHVLGAVVTFARSFTLFLGRVARALLLEALPLAPPHTPSGVLLPICGHPAPSPRLELASVVVTRLGRHRNSWPAIAAAMRDHWVRPGVRRAAALETAVREVASCHVKRPLSGERDRRVGLRCAASLPVLGGGYGSGGVERPRRRGAGQGAAGRFEMPDHAPRVTK
jgi:hypothetical protein